MKFRKKRILVVGDGLFANLLLFYLNEKLGKEAHSVELIQLVGSDFSRPTSELSTAIVARRNTEKGISKLGDLLVDSYDEVFDFCEKSSFQGFERIEHSEISSQRERKENFLRRFPLAKARGELLIHSEQGLLFYPEIFMQELRSSLKGVSINRSFALDFTAKTCFTTNREIINFDQVILGIGDRITDFFPGKTFSKSVRGSYLSFTGQASFFDHSFSVSIDGFNLIYRKKTNEFIAGSISDDQVLKAMDLDLLKSLLNQGANTFNLNLANLGEPKLKTAWRSKAPKREPFWGEFQKDYFSGHGFYKNGYSTCFLAAKSLSETISSQLL
jgi:hypothetical protein